MRTRGHSNALFTGWSTSPEDEQPDSTWERLTVFSGIHWLSSGCSRLCSLEWAAPLLSRTLGSSSAQAETAKKQHHCRLSDFVNSWLFSERNFEERVIARGKVEFTGEQGSRTSERTGGGSWSPSAQGHSPYLQWDNCSTCLFGANYLKLPALGLKQGKSRLSPQPMRPENMAALNKPLSNSKNPLQAGLRKRKEHLALEQDGVWGQAWREQAELLLSVLKATQVFVVCLTHGTFTHHTFFPVGTLGVFTIFHKRQGDTPEMPRSSSACILPQPMLATNTMTGPSGHKPGLPTGGKLLPIVKLSLRFGSCIFHVHRGTSHLFTRSLSQLISVQFSTSAL